MLSRCVIFMRGYPGCGKSTKAREIALKHSAVIASADDYFMKDGIYNFDVKKLYLAHTTCYDKFVKNVCFRNNVIIDNTNTSLADIKKYLVLIDELNATVSDVKYFAIVVNVKYNNVEEATQIRMLETKFVSGDVIKTMDEKISKCDLVKEITAAYPKIEIKSLEDV